MKEISKQICQILSKVFCQICVRDQHLPTLLMHAVLNFLFVCIKYVSYVRHLI